MNAFLPVFDIQMASAFMEELTMRIDNVCSLKWNQPVWLSDACYTTMLDDCRKKGTNHPALESKIAFKNLLDYVLHERSNGLFENATFRKKIHDLLWKTCADEPMWWPLMDHFTLKFL